MWRSMLVLATFGVSTLGAPLPALAQSAPGAVIVRESTPNREPAAILPGAAAAPRVIADREGPNLSIIVLPPDGAAADRGSLTTREPGQALGGAGQGGPPLLPVYDNGGFGNNGPFS